MEKQNIAIREQNLLEDSQRFEDSKQEFQLTSTNLKEWETKLNKLQNDKFVTTLCNETFTKQQIVDENKLQWWMIIKILALI